MLRSPYINKDKKAKYDYIFGLRLIAIILYGTLPSTLVILDIVKVKINITNQNLFLLIIIALIPSSILFLLIKNKLDKYYLMKDYSICRAILITLAIFIMSILVVGLSRTINGYYRIVGLNELELQPFGESFILAIGSMVLTSTLFWAFLTKDLELPCLPKKDFMNCIIETRQLLLKISKNIIFEGGNVGRENYEDIETQVRTSKNKLKDIQKACLAFNIMEQLINDLDGLEKAIDPVKDGAPNSWNRYFSENNREGIHPDDEKTFQGNMRIKKSLWR